MLRPTDNLRADHCLTAQATAALGAIASHVEAGLPFPAADAAVLLRFLREFVIAVHLRKETETLCPAVAMRGDEHSANLVGDLLRLQEEVTELAHSLVLFWEPIADLSAEERSGFAETVAAVRSRLLRMQEIEEQHLFPACDASVPADDQLDWAAQFHKLEFERGSRSEWAARIAPLLTRWTA
jgi:hemerythrin-like domain-containing protein